MNSLLLSNPLSANHPKRGRPALASPPPGARSRREFLGCAAVSLAAAGLCPIALVAAAKPKPAKVIVGAHPWVYAAKQPQYDITPLLPQIFADMEYADIEGIELMHNVLLRDEAVERIGELSRKHHLPVIGASYGAAIWDRQQHGAILKEAELFIPRLAKLGGCTLGTSVGQAPQRKTEAQLDAQAQSLRKLIALCQAHKVVLNLHNHTYEVADNLHDLKGTLARIPDVRLGPDLNWLVRGGVDPVAFIRQYGKQIVFLHLRDQQANGRWSEALGEGDMDYAAIAKALSSMSFGGHAIIELAHEADFQPTRPLRESLKLSRRFVRKVLGF